LMVSVFSAFAIEEIRINELRTKYFIYAIIFVPKIQNQLKPENSNSISCRIVPFHSALQKQSILLRDEVLRKPLNLSFTEEELNAEGEQIHIVAIHKEQVLGVLY